MKVLKKGKYLFGLFIMLTVLTVGAKVYAAPTVSNISGGPVRLIYDYIGHYGLNYTGNTSNYDYWDDNGAYKIVSKNYKDRIDISTDNNSSATISETDNKSKIVKAYLIWETRAEEGITKPIVFITPNDSRIGITAAYACKDTRTNHAGDEYTAVYTMATDVTSIVCGENGGYGTYTVANIPVWNGAGDGVACGGESVASWQLVVVEESPEFPLRTISLNIMSQYFFNVDYEITVDFADASAPNGVVTADFLNGVVDVTTAYLYDGIGYEDDHNYEYNGYYFRYFTQTRGLYKNGVSFNNRDTGSIYQIGSSAVGGTRVHLFNDKRRTNSVGSQTMTHMYAGTNYGANTFLYGVAIDIFAYDVIFDGNGADAGSMDNLTCVYGRGYNLPENQYSKQYYELAGWNTKADGSGTRYSDKGYIRNLTSTEKSVTLYAQWKPAGYTITLDHQDATSAGTKSYFEWYGMGNYTTSDCTEEISKITIPQKKGYSFAGYYTEKNGSGTKYVDADGSILSTSTTFTEDTTLYAKWIPSVSKITLDNQGAATAGTMEFYQKYELGNYTTSDCITAISKITNPTKTHYTFVGYYTEKNGEGNQIIDENGNILEVYTLFGEDTTLYAYWEPDTYIITLNNQDAINAGTEKFYEKYGVANYVSKPNMDELIDSKTVTFEYTGGPQVFVAPFDGTYSLTAYGGSSENANFTNGGVGGKTDGEIYLRKGEVLWIYVGGAGVGTVGGYNGGGDGGKVYSNSVDTWVTQGGGGATDFRKGGTALSNRIMVAGGGGGVTLGTVTGRIQYGGSSTSGYGQFSTRSSFLNSDSTTRLVYIGAGTTVHYGPEQDVPMPYNQGDIFRSDLGYTIAYLLKGELGQGAIGAGGGYIGGGFMMIGGSGAASHIVGAGGGSSYIKGVENGLMYTFVGSNSGPTYYAYYDGTSYVETDIVNFGNGRATITYDDYANELIEATTIEIPQKEGYRFGGYYTGTNGTGTCYVDESGNILSTPTTFTEATSLYAYWIADGSNTYQIAFNGNGATEGKMSIMTCNFDTNYTLNENTFARTAYTFTGWNTKADGSGTSYADKATVQNLSTTKGDVVTLYAQWEASDVSYTINHYLENLEDGWSLQSTEIKTGKTNSVVKPSSFAKTLTGFTYSHAEVKGVTTESAVIQVDGSLLINLYYSRNSYTVTLNKESGIENVTGAGSYKYGERVVIDAKVATGFKWYGWGGTYSTENKKYQFDMPAEDVTLTAATSPIIFKITLDNQRATETGTTEYYQKYAVGNYAESVCTTQLTIIQTPKKTGYEFNGYYTKTNGLGTQYITEDGVIAATSTEFIEDTVLYAYWTPISYIVRFEGNGSTGGSMSDFICTYEELCQLPLNGFVKTHYAFNSWNTEANGSGMTYVNGSMVGNLTSVPNGVITLYAQWTPNKYTIHFDANGGVGYMDDIVLSYDTAQKLPPNTFTRNNGYGDSTFLGWNIMTGTREVLYLNGAEILNATEVDGSTLILYAVWDDCPWIDASDLYYSLEDAKNGLITYDELMSHATASDMEDGEDIPKGVDDKKGTSFTIIDYQPTDFTQFTSDGSVTETFKVVDSVGKSYQQTITVYIVDTEPKVILPIGTTRFIDEKYYNASYENGGLEDNSIWKTDPEYINVIKQAFENSKNNTPIMSFHFEYEEILQMKQFIEDNGVGNSLSEDALDRFYVQFMEPNTVN